MALTAIHTGDSSCSMENQAADSRSASLTVPTSAAAYLFRRLHQLGVRAVHGVETQQLGLALELATESGLMWVEHYSELSAGYAADGYARIKGISALMTTSGSGELCALNAIAAAQAEYVPIVHIVELPPKGSQSSGGLLRHTLGNGDHSTFADMYRPLSCACAILNHPAEIADQIDHVLRECWIQSRPVYIGLPQDMMHQPIDGKGLRRSIHAQNPSEHQEKESYVSEVVLRYLNAASNPIILVDAGAIRHGALDEVHELVIKSKLDTFVSPMAKGLVLETLPNYCGVYAGSASEDDVRNRVEAADLVLSIGTLRPDFANRDGLTYRTSRLPTIYLHRDKVCVRYSEYHGVRMNAILRMVAHAWQPTPLHRSLAEIASHSFPLRDASLQTQHDAITHLWFWRTLPRWLQPHDIVLADPGVPTYGLWGVQFQAQATTIATTLWCSSGYGIPACQGAALAMSELSMPSMPNQTSQSPSSACKPLWKSKAKRPRTVLLTTPSDFQAATPELWTLLRQRLKPIILILTPSDDSSPSLPHTFSECEMESLSPPPLCFGLNKSDKANPASCQTNSYFSSHGNDSGALAAKPITPNAPRWCHRNLLPAMGAQRGTYEFHGQVRTRKQLLSLFSNDSFNDGHTMQVVEVHFGIAGDAPAAVARLRSASPSESQ